MNSLRPEARYACSGYSHRVVAWSRAAPVSHPVVCPSIVRLTDPLLIAGSATARTLVRVYGIRTTRTSTSIAYWYISVMSPQRAVLGSVASERPERSCCATPARFFITSRCKERDRDRAVVMFGYFSRRPKNIRHAMAHFPVERVRSTLRQIVPPENHGHVFGWRR